MTMIQERIQQPIQFSQSPIRSTTPESITALLNSLFPEQEQEEKEFKQVKAILGSLTPSLSPEEIHTMVTEMQYLVSYWLDSYEIDIFSGKTLKEVLNEE
jgi:hypothetical protein